MKRSIWAFCLVFILGISILEAAPLQKEERDAVVVIELTQALDEPKKTLFAGIERFGVREYSKLKAAYAEVRFLFQKDATAKSFIAALSELSAKTSNRAIDIFINLHGHPGGVTLFDEQISIADLRNQMNEVKGLSAKLRAVYSTACYGKSHVKEWLDAGFRVAAGAVKINTNGAYETPLFLKNWLKGETYGKSMERGNAERGRKFYDNAVNGAGHGPADSYKEVEGNASLTIND